MAAVGFEPTPPKRLVPKTSALDRSATLPADDRFGVNYTSKSWGGGGAGVQLNDHSDLNYKTLYLTLRIPKCIYPAWEF